MVERFRAAAIRIFAVAASAFVALLFAAMPLAAHAGTADNVTGWAWSKSVDWISMNCTNVGAAACAVSNYGVTLQETPNTPGRADITGYAWSDTVGWICFGATCLPGTTPEGGSPYAQWRASFNGKTNQIYGWARVLNMGNAGWISLNCDKDVGADSCATSNSFMTMDNATGTFTLGGANDHYAWGATDEGTGVGWVDFSQVVTTWVMANVGTVVRPEGIYEPPTTAPGTHLSTFSMQFQNFSAVAGQMVECEILLPSGARIFKNTVLTSSSRNATQTMTHTLSAAENVQQNKIWYIDKCRIAGSVLGAVCLADGTCGANAICDESVNRCRAVLDDTTDRRPIYTHGNTWSGLYGTTDQFGALQCNSDNPNEYFKNAQQCNFAGDASYALLMRRGIPVEGNCTDGVDNDLNGEIDCADRYCMGISHYRCVDLPQTTCVAGAPSDGIIDCTDPAYQQGELCCTKQPSAAGSPRNTVVDGMECRYRSPNDGYFDCDCNASTYNAANGCYAPGYTAGDLCCTSTNVVNRL